MNRVLGTAILCASALIGVSAQAWAEDPSSDPATSSSPPDVSGSATPPAGADDTDASAISKRRPRKGPRPDGTHHTAGSSHGSGSSSGSGSGKEHGASGRHEDRDGSSDRGSSRDHRGRGRVARVAPKPPCFHDAVEFERGFGGTRQTIVLTSCDGKPAPHAVEQLSILARPMNAPQPTVPATPVLHADGPRREWLPWVKLVDEGLVTRLQTVVDHFHARRLTVVSGYRPASTGSFHQSAKALDFRIDGVRNEALVAFCRTLQDTGCGYYPNSSFVHMDVRPPGTGHAYWIDSSGPGESPHYVSMWPPPRDEFGREVRLAHPIAAAPLDEHTHGDLFPQLPSGGTDARVDARTAESASRSSSADDPFHP